MTAELDQMLRDTRSLRKSLGFIFPKTDPEEVVLGPHKRSNPLSYSCRPTCKLPFLMDVKDGCKSLTQEDSDTISKNVLVNERVLENYWEEMVTKVMEDAVSTSIIFTQAPVKEEHKVIEMQSLTWCLFMFAL